MCQSITQQFISYTLKSYIVRATCFDLHWVILRPSKKTDPRLNRFFFYKKRIVGSQMLTEHLGHHNAFFVKKSM